MIDNHYTHAQIAEVRRLIAEFQPGTRAKVSQKRKRKLRVQAARALGWRVVTAGGVREVYAPDADGSEHRRPLPGIGELIEIAGLGEALGGEVAYPGPEAHIHGVTREKILWLHQGLMLPLVATRIAARRDELGYTQAACAAAAGMPQPQWADLERGRRSPTLATLARVADALDCAVADLVALDDD